MAHVPGKIALRMCCAVSISIFFQFSGKVDYNHEEAESLQVEMRDFELALEKECKPVQLLSKYSSFYTPQTCTIIHKFYTPQT